MILKIFRIIYRQKEKQFTQLKLPSNNLNTINPLAPEFFLNFSTPVYKMRIIEEPKKGSIMK
jgi:hypothetical protein